MRRLAQAFDWRRWSVSGWLEGMLVARSWKCSCCTYDASQTAEVDGRMADQPEIVYLRDSVPSPRCIPADEQVPLGGSKVLRGIR